MSDRVGNQQADKNRDSKLSPASALAQVLKALFQIVFTCDYSRRKCRRSFQRCPHEEFYNILVYESCYGIGMNLLLEERGKGRGHEACVPCFVLFHATFLEVEGDSLISF